MEYTVKHLTHFATDIVKSVGAETLVSKRVLSKKQYVLKKCVQKKSFLRKTFFVFAKFSCYVSHKTFTFGNGNCYSNGGLLASLHKAELLADVAGKIFLKLTSNPPCERGSNLRRKLPKKTQRSRQ